MKKLNLSVVVNSYFWLTVLSVAFIIAFWMEDCFLKYSIFLLGCHTVFYPLVGLFIVAETNLAVLVYADLWFWFLYVIAFVWSYMLAIWSKGYLPMAVVALIDTVFSAMILLYAIINAGFMIEHLLIIIGVLLSLAVTLVLFRGVTKASKNAEEMLRV